MARLGGRCARRSVGLSPGFAIVIALRLAALFVPSLLPEVVAAPSGLTAGAQAVQCATGTQLRLDHVSVAVHDLAVASRTWGQGLGFALKPGRPHPNGIENAHAKFHDGTEIELITAPEARDALTASYVRFLAGGEGGAYLALEGGPLDRVAARVAALGAEYSIGPATLSFAAEHRWHRLFFGRLNHSPTDLPEHFAHPNTAQALEAVWLSRPAGEALTDLLAAFDASPCGERALPPLGAVATRVPLRVGELLVLSPEAATPARGPVVGVSVRVSDVTAAAAAVGRPADVVVGEGRRSLYVAPGAAHGLWLELFEESFQK